jgi:hypothetical protein
VFRMGALWRVIALDVPHSRIEQHEVEEPVGLGRPCAQLVVARPAEAIRQLAEERNETNETVAAASTVAVGVTRQGYAGGGRDPRP